MRIPRTIAPLSTNRDATQQANGRQFLRTIRSVYSPPIDRRPWLSTWDGHPSRPFCGSAERTAQSGVETAEFVALAVIDSTVVGELGDHAGEHPGMLRA